MESAAEPQLSKANRDDYLVHERDKLFEAYSVAKNDVRRALVAQRLAAIAPMLNDRPSARKWLVGAYPIVADFVISVAAEIEQLFVMEWNPETVANIVAKVNPEPKPSMRLPQTGGWTVQRRVGQASLQGFAAASLEGYSGGCVEVEGDYG